MVSVLTTAGLLPVEWQVTTALLEGKSLSEAVEVVPLDVFLKYAASAKTYRTRYQQPSDPVDRNP